MRRALLFALSVLLLTGCSTLGFLGGGDAPDAAAVTEAETDDPFEDWDEALEDTTSTAEGFFTLHRTEDRSVYAEIDPEQLDANFGLVMHISQGAGVLNLHDGLRLSETRVMRFTRVGTDLHLVERNVRFRADEGSAMQRSLEDNTAHSVVESFDIKSRNDSTKHLLIDVTDFLASDYANIGERIKFYFRDGVASFDRQRSHVAKVRAFPENVEIDAALTYRASSPPIVGGEALPDYRSIPVSVRYSMFELPEDPMTPRLADDRVGHFNTAIKDFSRDRQIDPYRVYVNRWRLTPEDASAVGEEETVAPEEPIVFYVGRGVPERYVPYVEQGIEAWNKAFRAAGYEGAIVAKRAPDDSSWSAEDIRYSTVRWTAAHRMGYAIGPSQVDPRTGEILNADILISSSFVRGWAQTYQDLSPEAMRRQMNAPRRFQHTWPDRLARYMCRAEQRRSRQIGFQKAVMAGRGLLEADGTMPEEYLGDAIRDLVMHEVGHTLGLRHNFKASSGIPHERLNDEAFTREHGVSLSVMDYAPVNLAVDAEDQGHYWNTEVGTYDEWAIEYAYRPIVTDAGSLATDPQAEAEALDAIAAESSDPMHTYGTDEDAALGAYAVDPLTNAGELGDNPLAFTRDRNRIIEKVMPKLDDRLVGEGERYYRLRMATTALLIQRYQSASFLPKMIGGSYVARDHKDTPDARTPLRPVTAERQRETVELLTTTVFDEDAFAFDPERLNKLAPNRVSHWGSDPSLRIDYPVHDYVSLVQNRVLGDLLHPARLKRMIDTAVRMPAGQEPYRPRELMSTLTDAIWSELGTAPGEARPVNSFRRNLQRTYTERLTALMLDTTTWITISRSGIGQERAPEHVRSLARMELESLSQRIDRALRNGGGLNADTEAHLRETKVRIDRALDASVTETY
jgi:glycosyltransferase involved in cell wall biosynthesis